MIIITYYLIIISHYLYHTKNMDYEKNVVLEKIFNFIKEKVFKMSEISPETYNDFPWDEKKEGCAWICSEIYLSLEFFRKLNPSIYLPYVSHWEDKCETVEELRKEIIRDLSLSHLKFIKYILIDFDQKNFEDDSSRRETKKISLYDLLEEDVTFIKKIFFKDRINRHMKEDKYCENCGSFGNDEDGKLKKCSGCFSVFYCSEECNKSNWKTHKNQCKSM